MGAPTKEQRLIVYSALRRILGHVQKMQEQIDFVSEEVGICNKGLFQTRTLLGALDGITRVFSEKILEELARPGYKTIKRDVK